MALLLQVLYSIPSERLLVEQLDYNFLFHWFVGMGTNQEIWDHSSFTQNRALNVTPHVAQNTTGDGRTTRRPRKLVDEAFGWIKPVASLRKTRFRGRDRVGWSFLFAFAAYNLVRMRKLSMNE